MAATASECGMNFAAEALPPSGGMSSIYGMPVETDVIEGEYIPATLKTA